MNANINSSNWNLKEASIMVFGCMLHGPSLSILTNLIQQGLPMFIDMVLNDPSVSVRDSAAWVLSQICDGFISEIPGELTQSLVECLITALDLVILYYFLYYDIGIKSCTSCCFRSFTYLCLYRTTSSKYFLTTLLWTIIREII